MENWKEYNKLLAEHYKDNDAVIFGLMNQPNTMATEQWRAIANAGIVEFLVQCI